METLAVQPGAAANSHPWLRHGRLRLSFIVRRLKDMFFHCVDFHHEIRSRPFYILQDIPSDLESAGGRLLADQIFGHWIFRCQHTLLVFTTFISASLPAMLLVIDHTHQQHQILESRLQTYPPQEIGTPNPALQPTATRSYATDGCG